MRSFGDKPKDLLLVFLPHFANPGMVNQERGRCIKFLRQNYVLFYPDQKPDVHTIQSPISICLKNQLMQTFV